MNCDKCSCKNRAYPYIQNNHFGGWIDRSCPAIKFTRTGVADYYWCHVGGPPNDGTPSGFSNWQ